MKKLISVTVLITVVLVILLSGCSQATTTATFAPTTTQTQRPTHTTSATTTRPPTTTTGTIGLSVGGAKDINNFRENIQNNYLPLPTDITYEGLFYDYYFDTGMPQESRKLYNPSYSFAVTRDPLSHQTEYYMSVGLNSGLKEEDFARKKLNLAIVLDVSGSMSEEYNQYYYDNLGHQRDILAEEGIMHRTKIESATNAVADIISQLNDDDRLAIVTFNSDASVFRSMKAVRYEEMDDLVDDILDLRAGGNTNMSAGIEKGTKELRNVYRSDSYEYENRIIFLTDAQPNTGDLSASGMMGMVRKNAESHIYTTFIGIGVDFNSQLIDEITKVKGANYYSVHSPREFGERVNEEFEYMVTPLIFNVRLNFESNGWRIEKVFGSPEADQSTGELMKINTLFPSKSVGGETKGGLVLLKLRKTSSRPGEEVYLRVSYEDRNGRNDVSEQIIVLESQSPEYFDNSGIRKGILLTRYAALIKNWLADEYQYVHQSKPWQPSVREDTGITIPAESFLSQWERQSLPLKVYDQYKPIFREFSRYFEEEMYATDDNNLDQELEVLDILSR